MATLADRISQSKRLVLANELRAELIEAHVCRRLRVDPNDPQATRIIARVSHQLESGAPRSP